MKARVIAVSGESHQYQDFWYVDYKGGRLKVAVGDWAPNLLGELYQDPETARLLGLSEDSQLNGGVIGAAIAKGVVSLSEETGHSLVALINQALASKYQQFGLHDYRINRALTFTGYIAHAIVRPDVMTVTGVGDVRLAADERMVTGKTKLIDIRNASLRKQYIEKTGDVEGGFAYIKPHIIQQYQYQNVPGHEFSYPAIDGTETLPEGIGVITLPIPRHLLIWSDGYVEPDEFTLEGLERKLQQVYEEDPYRYVRYPEVGYLKSDRTAVEVTLDSWDKLEIELVQPDN